MTKALVGAIWVTLLGVTAGAPQMTIIRGRVLSAVTRTPVAGAIVSGGTDSVLTDANGAYELRVSRTTTWFGVRKDGWLDFQMPLLDLTTDTLSANVELRSDPPSPASYVGRPLLPYLCVRIDDAAHLDVTNSCLWPTYPEPEYVRKIIKHNPWNPYFGRAGDRGGVMLATRAR